MCQSPQSSLEITLEHSLKFQGNIPKYVKTYPSSAKN